MSRALDPIGGVNPFSTRFTRPGGIPFRFPPGMSPELLVERLRQNNWWGQVLGGHGSGKSALIAALAPAIQRAGRQVILIELHDAQRRMPADFGADVSRPTVMIVDGCEQLARWNRFRLKRLCRRWGLGLVVTSHRSLGLPDLFHTAVGPELAQEIVRSLLADEASLVAAEEVAACMDHHQGNLREVLFDLYDLYERRRPAGPAA
jgi:hypothetical protein